MIRLFWICLCLPATAFAQFYKQNEWIDQLDLKGALPEKLLSTRSALFYSYTLTQKELENTQDYFQRTGIDAVACFELDRLMAGKDITRAFSDYFNKREITNLIFLEKRGQDFRLVATTVNGKETVWEPGQTAWSAAHRLLTEVLKELYLTAVNSQKKQNLLISDFPETGLAINPILGRRNEFYAIDVKVDPLAIPKFGDPDMDRELEQIIQNNYPLKYKLTEPGVPEKDLRKQGYLYVVCFVNTRNGVAKDLLGYSTNPTETAQVSVTYPDGPQQVVKTIPSAQPVFKVYFKHIDSGNVFLGGKWDADLTWQQALLNYIRGLKVELRIN
jgi:hypothetical protein